MVIGPTSLHLKCDVSGRLFQRADCCDELITNVVDKFFSNASAIAEGNPNLLRKQEKMH